MKFLLTIFCLSLQLVIAAQTREEVFDYDFKPANRGGYYYVITEKKDSLWERQAWFISHKSLYMRGWYKDDSCKIGHGEFEWYHPNRYLRTKGKYVDGLREGVFLWFNEQGRLKDSFTYARGHKIGVGYSMHDNGYIADSTNFDGAGNGVEVRWYDDGQPSAAGRWTKDTLKTGRWQYFHRSGTLMANEDYNADGKLIKCNCYDEKGVQLDTAVCGEKEATVDQKTWIRFLQNDLQSLIEQKAKEGISGNFTVMVRFVIDRDGSTKEVVPLTNYGHGIEEGVIKIFNKAPLWSPGRMHGKNVKSYHTQPITFVISAEN